jgi:hypothetical protein
VGIGRRAGLRQRRAGVNQFSPRSIRYLVGAYSQEIGSKSQDVFAAPVSSELSDSQKNAMLDPDTHHAWKQREFWYFVLIFLSVIGFLILLGNAKAYL